jgi:C-terminal processing protease CtpA/Prc
MANPDIRNIIFDLTANAGGSQDLMSSIIGLFTGDVAIHGYNHLTKQHMQAVFTTDRNMDGVIDEKDKDVVYDYHLGVLTSRLAFSCGNLFPVIMQEKGAAVIGENTGGGSCVVQMVSLSDGPVFMISSYQWHLRNAKGEEVENGADPDMPIERIENVNMENPYFPRLTPGDYSPYYNDEMPDQLMNEWFAEEVVPAA